MGVVELKTFNGNEIFKVKNATINAKQLDSLISIWIEYDTEKIRIKNHPEYGDNEASPNANIAFKIKNINILKKFKTVIPVSYDSKLDEYVSDFYYYEHNDIDKNKLEITHKHANIFYIKWTGITDDINFYDGSKPRIVVSVEGEFIFKDYNKWFNK